MKSFHTLFLRETHVGLVWNCILQTLHCFSQSEKRMPTAGYFLFLFLKVNPWTLLDLLVCVQPAPGKLWYAELPAALSLPGLPRPPSPGLLLRPRYIIFKYRKWWLDCSCQVSGHSHPRDQIQQTLCSHLTWRYPLFWSTLLAWLLLSLSLSWLSASQWIFPFSPLWSLSLLCFTCDCYSGLSSILPLFLPPFLPSFSEYARPRWSHHSQCLILRIC